MPDKTDWRIFVALPLPEAAKSALLGLNSFFPELKFSLNLHLTLRFIGHVPDIRPYAEILRKVRSEPFDLEIKGLGLFSKGILYAAPKHTPQLANLKRQVDFALQQIGLEIEDRQFLPHITLCRFKRNVSKNLQGRQDNINLNVGWKVDQFCLYSSNLTACGAIHTVERCYSLKN